MAHGNVEHTEKKRVYLAGPDVFLPQAKSIGAIKKSLCEQYGFEGLFPFDKDVAQDTADASADIYQANMNMIARAHFGILNLTPFRGPSADVGTVFELGVLVAQDKPVFAYTNQADTLIERLKTYPGLTLDEHSKEWRDSFLMGAEDFGNSDNLMIDRSLAAQGRTIHRVEVDEEGRFLDLAGFKACLEEARAFYAAGDKVVALPDKPRTKVA